MQCPACAVDVPDEDQFCEACGAPLAGVPVAGARCACGAAASEVDEDGFCLRCGRKARVALAWDRVEESASAMLVAVSDRGLRHDRNEDRFAVYAGEGVAAMVVCDGVSATRTSEIASEAVSAGVLEALRVGDVADPEQRMRGAIAAGAARLETRTNQDTRRSSASRKLGALGDQAPSTTVVAAMVAGGRVTVGWVGDSRAYWIAEGLAEQMTVDHSWMNEVVSSGLVSAEEAARSPKAHAITRWLGADAVGGEAEPGVVSRAVDTSGFLLLCTDGLWNYAASAEEMLALFEGAERRDVTEIARDLVKFALDRGGMDNITVALMRIEKER